MRACLSDMTAIAIRLSSRFLFATRPPREPDCHSPEGAGYRCHRDRVLVEDSLRCGQQAEAELGATYATLPELLQQADYVTLNMPLTPETRNIIGRAELAMMKPSAILVNLARGGVVDHEALLEALQNNTIWAAAIDVTEPEPLPRDHPLLKQQNLIIVPHLGSATMQTRQRMIQRTVDNLLAGLKGNELLSRVA